MVPDVECLCTELQRFTLADWELFEQRHIPHGCSGGSRTGSGAAVAEMEVSRHGIRIGIQPVVDGLINAGLRNAVRPVTGPGAAGIERNADGDRLPARVGDDHVPLPVTQYRPERPCGCQRMSRAEWQFVR